jgi:hypothetical protein
MTKTADPNIEFLLQEFSARLTELVERRTIERLQVAAAALIGSNPDNPSRAARAPRAPYGTKRTPYVRECPVPGCKNPPAPAFGMVCSQHKDLPKAEIKKYREARALEKKAKATPQAAIPSPAANGKPRKRPAIPA